MESGPIRVRLSLMMFGQYLILGAWCVPLATYLLKTPADGGLGFEPSQVSWIYSTIAIAALLAPLFLGLLADRLFAAQRLLGVLHIAGACVLFGTAEFCSAQQLALRGSTNLIADTRWTFGVLMLLMLANSIVLILTLSLCNVTGFRNLKEPKKSYGGVRLFGTVAWIVVNVGIDVFGNPLSAQPLYVAAACSIVMGIYSFTLPHTPPARLGKGIAHAFGLPALKMFRNPGFRVLIVCALCMSAVQQFFTIYANPFLRELGASKPMALQTVAQVSEVICMLSFPFVLARFGYKATLAVGVFGWVIRNLLFATGYLPAIGVFALPLHGMCYTFFFIVANVYVDRHAPAHLRASAQGIFTFTVSGIGTLAGNLLSAQVLEANRTDAGSNWAWFWLVPAAIAAVVFVLFLALFRDDHFKPAAQTLTAEPEPLAATA
ncbi:MAG TPA: MFS transporter [Gemmataceae bacterium]|jgi:nucleoside transporter|nr:MFS transporter [Gemmataceae bacterium]